METESTFADVIVSLLIVVVWLSIAFKIFRFDKFASNIFNGTFASVVIAAMLIVAFGTATGLIGAMVVWVTGSEQIGLYIGLAGATLIAIFWIWSQAAESFGSDYLAYLVKEEIPARIRDFLKVKVARETEEKNTDLVLKLASQIIEEEKSSGWYYFLATIFFIGTYFFLKDYEHGSLYYYLEYMDWWKKTPLLLVLYVLFMLFYRWIYRSRFIKAPFAKIVGLLEVLSRAGQHMVFYDSDDGERFGLCLLDEKPVRYPDTPREQWFVDIGDGEIGYLLSPVMEYVVFRSAYFNIRNGGVRGYLDWLKKKHSNA